MKSTRDRLPQLSAQLDRLLAEADSILAEPVYADIGRMAEELRELVVDMQAKVEEKLDAAVQDDDSGWLSFPLLTQPPHRGAN
jgi:hypothetical protein